MFDSFFARVGEAAATPPDYIKLFTLLIVAYPLAYPLPGLPPHVKHAFSIATSFLFLFGILNLRAGYAQLLATALATYALARFRVGGANMPWIVFGVQMGHLTVNHLVRAFGDIPLTTIEITAAQMVLCMNLTSFAWSVHDGRRPAEECDAQQKEHRITEFPDLLEFLGYAFFFPGVLIGPSTRFVDYRAWSRNTLYGGSSSAAPRTPPKGRVRAAITELVLGFAFMGVWAVLAADYNYEALLLPKGEPGSALDRSLLSRIWITNVAGLVARTKYYGIWGLANGACVLSGLAYNGLAPAAKGAASDEASRSRWDRCRNIDPVKIEFANNWKELLDAWNMNTNVWLRNCVYKRVAKPGKKPGFKSTMLTFMTSAFWHGVAPGYYLTFVLGGLAQSVGRTLRKHLRPIVFRDPRAPNPSFGTLFTYTPAQLVYCGLSIVAVQLSVNFTVLPFMLLGVRDSLAGWHALGYYGLVVVVALMAAFRAGLGVHLDRASGVAQQKKADKKLAGLSEQGKANMQMPDVVSSLASEAKKEL